MGWSGNGWFGDAQQLQGQGLSAAGSAVAPSSPFLGTFLAKVLGSGGLGEWEGFYDNQFVQDPFTGTSYADPFTTETYGSPGPFTTGVGSIAAVISVGDVPTAGEALDDVQASFAAPATEDVLLASNDPSVAPSDPDLDLESSVVQFRIVNGVLTKVFVPASDLNPPLVLSDAPGPNFQPWPGPPVSQPSTSTGQPTPPVTSSTVSPVASDYNPAADRGDVPNVYVPTYSYPPIDTWPTSGPSAPPITSSPSMLTPPPNVAPPSPQALEEQDWSAAKAGMWDSVVDMAQSLSRMSFSATLNMYLPGFGHYLAPKIPMLSLDWAKFGPPAPTGDSVRDAELLDNYRRGGWVATTISLAAPIGAEGLLDSVLAANKLPALEGEQWLSAFGETGAAEEVPASGLLGPELRQSLPAVETEASVLFKARDQAAQTAREIVEQEMRDGRFSSAASPPDLQRQVQRRFGMWLDAIAKTNIRQAVAEERLPNTFATSPTMGISRGYLAEWRSAPDIWDTATGRAWDFHRANEAQFFKHEELYLDSTAYGPLDPSGTVINELFPLFHTGF